VNDGNVLVVVLSFRFVIKDKYGDISRPVASLDSVYGESGRVAGAINNRRDPPQFGLAEKPVEDTP
jgi:hypothetical protein